MKKILFLILILFVLSALAQNSNVVKETATKAIANKAITPTPKPTFATTPTPIPSNTTIRGKAFFEDDGKPVRRSVIIFFALKGSGREHQTLTDENGNFEINDVTQGNYFPMIFSAGVINFFSNIDFGQFSNEKLERDVFADFTEGFQEIIVDGKTNLEVKIPVKMGGLISGKVTYADGSPATGRPIQLLRKINGKLQPIVTNFLSLASTNLGVGSYYETDDKGFYRFSGLPADEYIVRVVEPTIHGFSYEENRGSGPNSALAKMFGVGSFLNTYYPSVIGVNEAKPIKVELGKEQSNINITIPDWKLHKVSGKIISSNDGKPVRANVFINIQEPTVLKPALHNLENYSSSAGTDENGNWSFRNIPNGEYVIRVEPWTDSQHKTVSPNKEIATVPRYAKVSQNLIVNSSNVENFEIKPYLAATITGDVVLPKEIKINEKMKFTSNLNIKVLNEQNEIVENELVWFYDSEKSLPFTSPIKFKIEGLSAEKIKLKVDSLNENVIVKSATANGVDLLNNFIELKEGQLLSNVRIVLEKKK